MKHRLFISCLYLILILCLCSCSASEREHSDSSTSSTMAPSSDVPAVPSIEETTQPTQESLIPESPSREYSQKVFTFHEPQDFSYILSSCEETSQGNAAYCFETDCPLDLRERFISCQEMLNEKLGFEEPARFILTEHYLDRADNDLQAGFFLSSSIESWRQVLITLQMIEGADTNYGYLYAKADRIANELSWRTDPCPELSEEALKLSFTEDPGRLNLFYPCFITPYSTEEQSTAAKLLAKQVFSGLEQEDEAHFLAGLTEVSIRWGLGFEPTYLRFLDGGRSCPLIILTHYLEERLTREFTRESFYTILENTGLEIPNALDWQKNMTELVRLRELADREIDSVRSLLQFEEKSRVTVIFQDMKKPDDLNYYDHGERKIHLHYYWSVCHEYIHYIHFHISASPYRIVNWHTEALATYLGWNMYQDCYDRLEPLTQQTVTPEKYVVERFSKMMVDSDITPTEILLSQDPSSDNYAAYYSVAAYLVEQYQKEIFVQLMVFPEKCEELTGRPMEEILADWDQWVKQLIP